MTEMSPAEEIFFAALDKADPAEREAYLEAACAGQPDLRIRVARLLEAHPRVGDFLGSTPDVQAEVDLTLAPTASAAGATPLEGPGTKIGPYKLLQQIGEGGMGIVFMAEQEKPVRRKVALKVIKPGMDTKQVVARFEAERQALAMMDHPNIARVLDVGATSTGRPFFVMELVKGMPITEYCDRNQLAPKERLELFMPVCRAIQHAHQKGIIHRDIKPSNVLITLHDGQPVPKVIDFGIAKAIDQRLTERTMFTEFGAVIGTLEYMSPEQAEMGALDIDTRSDIYSLGVLLYELLTGSTPLERAKLRKAAYSEVLRRIREEEPAKPSTRLSESKDALPSISAQRKMEPVRLTKLVRGDLDWIVMKSLEKDRTRRYETATGFARDIQRYLEGDAVEACPPSASYKLRKFARKHRPALLTAGVFAFFLLTATAVSLGLAYWANRERVRAVLAEIQAEKQKQRAEAALSATQEQRKRAEIREEQAIEAVKRFGDVISKEPELKNSPQLQELRKKLLKEPQAFFKRLRDRLQADNGTTPESLERLAKASYDLGRITQEIGDMEDALRAYQDCRTVQERLVRADPPNVGLRSALATTLRFVGGAQHEIGRAEEASRSLEQAGAILEQLAKDDPSVVVFQQELARNRIWTGILWRDLGRTNEALSLFEQSLQIRERLARQDPASAACQDEVADSHHQIGKLMAQWMDRPEEALAHLQRALEIREKLARENPAGPTLYQRNLAWDHYEIGDTMERMGRIADSLASHQKAREIRERLVRQNPTNSYFRRDLARSHNQIGSGLRQMGRPDEALTSYEKALDISEQLVRENPSMIVFQEYVAGINTNIGIVKESKGRLNEAIVFHEKARECLERLVRASPLILEYAGGLAQCYNDTGLLLERAGRPEEARASQEKALVIRERLARENPSISEYHRGLAQSHNNIGILNQAADRLDEAFASFERAREIRERLARENPSVPLYRSDLVLSYNNIGFIRQKMGRMAEALASFEKAREIGERLTREIPETAYYRQQLVRSLNGLMQVQKGLGRADEVARARREIANLNANDPAKAALDARLAAVLGGQHPVDELERCKLAFRAYEKSRYAASVRLFAEAFAKDPKLTDDRQAQHAYNAARAAARAATGQGIDDSVSDETTRAQFRRQALGWLRAELAAWTRTVDPGTANSRLKNAITALKHWKEDCDLVGIRDEKELSKLPEAEREALRKLWIEVDRILATPDHW